MKTSFSIAAMSAVLGLAVASTIAQTETTSTTTYIQTSKLVGKPVKSSQGEEIGTIKDVVLDRNTGCLAYTVLATGGGGGQVTGGGKMVAVPWSVYSASSDVNTYTVTVDRERIYSAPVFDYAHVEEYSRPDYINNVYGYFGVTAGAAIGTAVSSTTGDTHTTNVNTTTGTTTRGTSTRGGAMASPGASAAAGEARSPAQAGSPSPRTTAARSPHETPAGRTHATPRSRSGATESSPTERTRGTKEEREGSAPPSGRSETGRTETGRGETGTRPDTERAPSEATRPSEKATGSDRHEKGKREASTPQERPQE
jgi:sporulation protein YlmC with PRC-barrel domain